MTHRKPIIALAGAAGMLLGASAVTAQTTTTVACSDTSILPNPVYMAGSSAFEPILSQLAVQIKAKQGVSIIYSPISSCLGVSAISPPADDPTPQPLTVTPHYYGLDLVDSTKTVYNSCNLSGNTMATIGVSDVAFDSCQQGSAKPATIGEWAGPVQAMLMIVPERNITTTAISAEQAAAIWGCGTGGKVGKFLDGTIQQRSATSGTQILVAKNIGVQETAFKGISNASGPALITSLLAVPDPQTAIGFLANDAYAPKRSLLNSLAFRGINQTKAYYADSTATADDLKNVRDGHYMIQGPLHLFTKLMADGQPAANAKLVLDWLTGAVPIDPTDPYSYVRTVANGGDVPQCAMKVKLSKDGGKFSPYTPPVSCNCAFEKVKQVPMAAGACPVCTSDSDCTGGATCQTGYCE